MDEQHATLPPTDPEPNIVEKIIALVPGAAQWIADNKALVTIFALAIAFAAGHANCDVAEIVHSIFDAIGIDTPLTCPETALTGAG